MTITDTERQAIRRLRNRLETVEEVVKQIGEVARQATFYSVELADLETVLALVDRQQRE